MIRTQIDNALVNLARHKGDSRAIGIRLSLNAYRRFREELESANFNLPKTREFTYNGLPVEIAYLWPGEVWEVMPSHPMIRPRGAPRARKGAYA